MEWMLLFVPDDRKSDSKIEVQTQNIENHKYSKESHQLPLFKLTNKQGRSHTFVFGNYPDMNAFRDIITKALAKCEEDPKKSTEQLCFADLELRVKLLRENSELQRLHKQFVESKTNKVTFNFTPEIIFQFFAEKPAVRQAFINYVPSKITEKDFWTKYFRAEYLYSTKNTAVAAAEATEDELLAVFLKPDEISAREARRKIRRVDPTLDMVADHAGDDTLSMDQCMDVAEPHKDLFKRRSLAQDIDRHGAAVLEGRSIDVESEDSRIVAEALTRVKHASKATKDAEQERLEKMSRALMEDLQAPKNFAFDPRDYFESQQGNVLNEPIGAGELKRNVHEAYGLLKESISELRFKNHGLFALLPKLRNVIGKNPREKFLDRLPKSIKDEILHQWTSIQELLRHFCSSFPITTTYLYTKVLRLKDAMSNIYSQLEVMKESVQSDLRHEVSLLVRPMQQALDAAFQQLHDMSKHVYKVHLKN
ncbi:hypothetical protein EUTSA_v10011448mg [Eutrema salsugineum]|uniref:BSD domain-containing protein n=1 Tax=Eutrema salsugineum TaxID=72664 RepID=V4KU38_EUTSA|nr:hypothetical protein EUTSA_v10011448mg [Eutrema salsugineum]